MKYLLLFFLLISSFTYSQAKISGKVINTENTVIELAVITIDNKQKTLTNSKGVFVFNDISKGKHTIVTSYLGYKINTKIIDVSSNYNINIILEASYENLNSVVITGNFQPIKQLNSSTSVSVLNTKKLKKSVSIGTADIIKNVPGTFVDASAGEVFTKVYSRGISASAEDDMGWYYTSLQEDGLPISLIQHSYYSPDLFYRSDITTQKLESVSGGSASITAMNAPGGIYNFISFDKTNSFGGRAQLTSGFQGDNNLYYKTELAFNGALTNNWFFNIGGHYRRDDGARNVDFTFSKGGQIKFNLIKKHNNGYFKLYGKYLNDKTNRWNGVTANNWNNPTAVYGQDFNTTSQLLPAFNASIPTSVNSIVDFNPSQGIHAKDLMIGFDFSQELENDWSIKNNIKFSQKSANWQTAISNAFVSIHNPLAYFITGAGFPIGNLVFIDSSNKEPVAQLDNSAILTGGTANYLTNETLPNDALLGTAAWYKDTQSKEIMNHLVLRKKLTDHDITTGIDIGHSNTKHFTNSSFVFATYENNPRTLIVTLENPNTPVVSLSDENGVSNYGGLFFEKANAYLYQSAFFLNDTWKTTEKLQIDAGIRYEYLLHQGDKYKSEPFSQDGGYDGNTLTDYDNGVLISSNEIDSFDFNYNYLSYSLGVNYKILSNTSSFIRYSKGNKAPEFNYYFNNFSNVPIPKKGAIQNIHQLELGIKHFQNSFSTSATAFYSELNNIGTTNFEFDENTNTVFYTPTQFNSSRTFGLELETMYQPFKFLKFNINGVLQNATSKTWTVYNANESVDTTNDTIESYDNKTLPFNPNLIFDISSTFEQNDFYVSATYRYMGKRYGNIANGFVLPSYATINLAAGLQYNQHWDLSFHINNLLNADGLANFLGPNSFGGNANQATPEYIKNNPDGNFIVIPILPIGVFSKLNYTF